MTDDQNRPDVADRSEQAKPERPHQQPQPSQASAVPEPVQRRAPGRKPLFGT